MTNSSSHRNWQQLGAAMTSNWNDDRARAVKGAIEIRQKEQKWRRITGVALLFVALSGGAMFTLWMNTNAPSVTDMAVAPELETVSPLVTTVTTSPTLEPSVQALTPGTRFTVEEGVNNRSYKVADGAVRFETNPQDTKELIVRVGTLVIEDIGTIFTVETLPHERARVAVSEGRVQVSWPAGRHILLAGETGEFPPKSEKVHKEKENKKSETSVRRASPSEDWRLLARSGRYQQAYSILARDPSKVHNWADDLLLAADVMRLSGRPKRAVGYLEQVLKRHKKDPRANLAAFTLGRVYLDELGRPLQAARAFKSAGGGSSPLAEESLAREVEAWSRAGELMKAKKAALRYVKKYPKGSRVDVVCAFGGLDEP